MHKSFINFRYIGKYTNRPAVSFFYRFALLICRDDFSSFKTFRKNTSGDTIIRYNSISEVTTFSFSIKVILPLVVTLFPKIGFTAFQNFLESLTLPNSKFS